MKALILLKPIILFFVFSALTLKTNAQSTPVVCMPFNGNALDISGNNHHGNVVGATLTSDRFGNANSAYDFDGVDDHIQLLDPLSSFVPNDELTIVFWAKADAMGNNSPFLLYPNSNTSRLNIHIYYDHVGIPSTFWDYGNIGSGGRLYLPNIPFQSEWQHYAFVVSQLRDSMCVYRDGIFQGGKKGISTILDRSRRLNIGGGISDVTNCHFNGQIDDVQLFNVALTASEISNNYLTLAATPIITAGGNTTFCEGGSVLLSVQATAFGYQWIKDGVNIIGANASTYTVTTSGSYSCAFATTCISNTSPAVNITVNPLPNVSFTGLGNSYICNSLPVTLTGNPSGGTFSGPGISGNTFDPSTLSVGGPYAIDYSYTGSNGCSNSVSQNTNIISGYNCLPPQGVAVSAVGMNKVTFTWNYSSASQYQIRYKKVSAATYTNKTISALACQNSYTLTGLKKNTQYQLSIRAKCGTATTAYSNTITFTTALARMSGEEIIETAGYPNPVTDVFNIVTDYEITDENCTINVVDVTGRILISEVKPYQSESEIDMSGLHPGIYLVQLIYGDEKTEYKILKE